MQKRPYGGISVSYSEITFPEDFPVAFTRHVQRYQSGEALHFHNGIEIGICYEGTGLFFIDNRILSFGPGDVSIIFPDQPHIAQSPDANPSRWSFLTVDTERLFCDMSTDQFHAVRSAVSGRHFMSGILPGAEYRNLSALVRILFEELESTEPNHKLSAKGLILSILLMASRLSEDGSEQSSDRAPSEEILLLSPAISHICSHYPEDVTVPDLAKLCNLSVSHFRRLFHRTMGRSPSEYLLEVRMRMARSLLKATAIPISEVSMIIGFGSLSSFNRHFKECNGISPREYRGKHKE